MEDLGFELGFEDELDRVFNESCEDEFKIEAITESNLVPKIGCFLGLDISENSTGICIYENGTKLTKNFSISAREDSPFIEVLLRRSLKADLRSLIFGKNFDVIIIEDAFQGVNPSTTRLLYSLNTAIDEMILDSEVFCKTFIRVNNREWKSWLYKIDSNRETKGLKDKPRIEKCLEMLGVTETGDGYQDRLDATGLLLGYFLNKNQVEDKLKSKKKKKVCMSDVEYAYDVDSDCIRMAHPYLNEVQDYEFVSERLWSKSKIISYLTENPTKVYITSDYVKLGKIADDLNLPYIDEGGIFAFWVKKSKLSKYKQV